jgi:hypothetical protein
MISLTTVQAIRMKKIDPMLTMDSPQGLTSFA